MSVVRDILRSHIAPVEVTRNRLSISGEATALATLMAASLLIFAAQWPRLGREAHLNDTVPFEALLGGALLGILFIFPLVAYAFSGVFWLILKIFGKGVTGLSMRVVLFWAFLSATPPWLLYGFVDGFLEGSRIADVIGIAVLIVFSSVLVGGIRSAIQFSSGDI